MDSEQRETSLMAELKKAAARYPNDSDCRHSVMDEVLLGFMESLGYKEEVDYYLSFERWFT